MNMLSIGFVRIAMSVTARFSFKAGISSAEIVQILRAPLGFHAAVKLTFNK